MSGTALTREAIVGEAVRLADEGGLEKVSMRRIADALGTGAMSLYRYVPDKNALLTEMSATVGKRYQYPPALLGDPDWRARVHAAAEADMELYLHHPWVLLAHNVPRAALSEASVLCFDWLVEALTHLTGELVTAAELALQVWNHVQGTGLAAVGRLLLAPEAPSAPDGFIAGFADNPLLDGFPRLRELASATNPAITDELLLRAGVDALCDGFAVRYCDDRPR